MAHALLVTRHLPSPAIPRHHFRPPCLWSGCACLVWVVDHHGEVLNGDACGGVLIHVASEADLSLVGSEGAGLEAAIVKLRDVVIDVCHSQRDPYARLGLLPVDVGVRLGGLRAELKPEGRGQRASVPKELRSKVKVGVQRVGVQRGHSLTVTCTCTSSSSSSSSSLSRGLLTVITPSCLPMSNQPGLVESGKRQQEWLLPVALRSPHPFPCPSPSLGTPRSHWRCCRSQGH